MGALPPLVLACLLRLFKAASLGQHSLIIVWTPLHSDGFENLDFTSASHLKMPTPLDRAMNSRVSDSSLWAVETR